MTSQRIDMTPGELFRIALRVLGLWTILTTLAQTSWTVVVYSPGLSSSSTRTFGGGPQVLSSCVVATALVAIGVVLVRSARWISARFHFEPEELKQSGELTLNTQTALQVALQVMGISLMLRSVSSWAAIIMWLPGVTNSQQFAIAELLKGSIYLIVGWLLLLNASLIAGRWEEKRFG